MMAEAISVGPGGRAVLHGTVADARARFALFAIDCSQQPGTYVSFDYEDVCPQRPVVWAQEGQVTVPGALAVRDSNATCLAEVLKRV